MTLVVRILFFLFILFFPLAIQAQQNNQWGKAIFWFSASNPFPAANSPKGPLFVLYETGNVLYWQAGIYRLAELDNQEFDNLKEELQLADTLFSKTRLVDAVNDPGSPDKVVMSDYATSTIYINTDSLIRVTVLGNIIHTANREYYPQQVLNMYQVIRKFSESGSRAWLPEKINIILTEDNEAQASLFKWPANWPQVVHNNTAAQRSVVHLLLDSKYYDKLLKLYKQQEEMNLPVYINGKNYRIDYRINIPGTK